jgi:hypothetical protein
MRDIQLVQVIGRLQTLSKKSGLVVKPRTFDIPIDFLQANQVRIFAANNIDHSLDAIAPISAADAFVNVVAQQSHGFSGRSRRRLTKTPAISSLVVWPN